jgi:hypothetical protein
MKSVTCSRCGTRNDAIEQSCTRCSESLENDFERQAILKNLGRRVGGVTIAAGIILFLIGANYTAVADNFSAEAAAEKLLSVTTGTQAMILCAAILGAGLLALFAGCAAFASQKMLPFWAGVLALPVFLAGLVTALAVEPRIFGLHFFMFSLAFGLNVAALVFALGSKKKLSGVGAPVVA